MASTQSLNVVANVSVSVSPVAAASPDFNQGLIIGSSSRIPTTDRVRKYTGLTGMAADGFLTSDPEYIAAQLYFSQTPAPPVVWVGRQDLTASETTLAALTACRAVCPNWWAVYITSAVSSEHANLAAFVQGSSPAGCYFYTIADSAVLAGTAGNVCLTLKAQNYDRAFGVYATTQTGSAPNNVHAAAAAMGAAMGLNTGLANSNFTMKFKQLAGVQYESITPTQVANIENANCNVNLNYANVYTWLEQGACASGKFLDEVLGIDALAADLQYSLVNALISMPAIPMTNAGEMVLIAAANGACERALSRGFISPGVWQGQTVLELKAGDSLPKGYRCQAASFLAQSAGDRAARKAMPIYVTVLLSGAMHSITVGVYVER